MFSKSLPILFATAVTAVLATNGAAQGTGVPSAGRVVARIAVPDSPLGLFVTPGTVWVAAHHGTEAYRINMKTNTLSGGTSVFSTTSGEPGRFVKVGSRLIEVNYSSHTVSVVDPTTGKLVRTFEARYENCCWPVAVRGKLWVLGYSSRSVDSPDRLSELDPVTGRVLFTRTIPNAQGLVYGAGSLWGVEGDHVFRFDVRTKRMVAKVPVAAWPFAFAFGSVWALDGSQLVRIGPEKNAVSATIELPAAGAELTSARGAIWVDEGPLDSPGSHVWKVDPKTNTVAGVLSLGQPVSALDDITASSDGSLWVTLFDTNRVLRIATT